MAFDLKDYVEVKTRIQEFKEKHPDGRLTSEIIPTPFTGFITVKAYAYRTPDDPTPGTGLAWEPVPGKTPYTKDSELQNAETSAWGRALVAALIADATSGVASADEVRNRTPSEQAGGGWTRESTGPHETYPGSGVRCPDCGGDLHDNRERNFNRGEGEKRWPPFKCIRLKECGWKTWDDHFFEPLPIREDYPPGQEPFEYDVENA